MLSFEHHRERGVAEWIDELSTHSIHHRLDPRQIQRLASELETALGTATNGRLSVRFETFAVTGLLREISTPRIGTPGS